MTGITNRSANFTTNRRRFVRSQFSAFASSCLLSIALALLALPSTAQSKKQPQAAPPSPVADLGQLVPAEMQKWNVPGLAIAVVQNGQVIYSHGFGLRDVKNNLPVTTKTLFAIGSISKSFTSLSMGILNDQGKLDWDKPVRQYIPEFQMYDPVASERMTPRDLISHRVNMAGHDLVWYSSDFSREDLVHRLRFLQSDHDFRSGYNYNNLLVATAGYLVGRIAGESWEDFTHQHVFEPLQMSSSNFSVADSQKSSDFSHPYRKDEHTGEVSEIPFHALSAIAPAGSINSNVEDMARYAIFQLGNGKVGDRQVISAANLKLTHTAQVPMGPSPYKETGPYSYAMGWVDTSYRGHPLTWHNGGIDGFYALLSLLPDDNFGVVILTNRLRSPLPEIVAYNIYDRLFNLPPIEWSKRFQEQEEKQKTAAEQERAKEATERKQNTHPSHELKEYAGRYENPGYGTLTIQVEGDGLTGKLNNLTFPLRHYHYDVFETPDEGGAIDIGKMRFLTNMAGNIDSVAAPLEPDAPEIIFTRVAEKETKPADSGQ
ncbi:MAG TPA: serine hydrolase [Candidatus Sulfotelmatobacter sp.]|nr:serine hydrolase [Candidatus Sulfotelmatobacter sp.]